MAGDRPRVGKRYDDIVVLKGIECDILERGGMDLPDDVLAEADWVIASVHYGQKQPREQITERILGALENPHVDVIAHPTGRLINRRDPYEVDLDAVIAAAARHGKLLELNANPVRLDLDDVHCAAAKRLGIPIVINTDAHSTAGFDVMRYGVLQARRGGLTAADVANTRPWAEFRKLHRAGDRGWPQRLHVRRAVRVSPSNSSEPMRTIVAPFGDGRLEVAAHAHRQLVERDVRRTSRGQLVAQRPQRCETRRGPPRRRLRAAPSSSGRRRARAGKRRASAAAGARRRPQSLAWPLRRSS